mgnify:CR=1 FL=1
MGSSISIEKLRKLAEENSAINIDDLINKIQYIKHDNLTKFEEKYLCLILCQFSADEIAFIYDKNRMPTRREIAQNKEYLKKRSGALRADASKGLNTYLKELIGLDDDTPLPQFKNGKLIKELRKVCKTNDVDNSNDEIRIVIKGAKKISQDMKDLLVKVISSIEFE